jgi:hypothetical protein
MYYCCVSLSCLAAVCHHLISQTPCTITAATTAAAAAAVTATAAAAVAAAAAAATAAGATAATAVAVSHSKCAALARGFCVVQICPGHVSALSHAQGERSAYAYTHIDIHMHIYVRSCQKHSLAIAVDSNTNQCYHCYRCCC